MTFEEWAEQNNLSAYGKACSQAAWQAALQSERERAKELVEAAEYAAEILDQYVQRHAHAKYVRSVIAKYEESP